MDNLKKKMYYTLIVLAWKLINHSSKNEILFMKESRKRLHYVDMNPVSKMLTDIIEGNDKSTRQHIRISSRVFWRINSFLPKKRHGWGTEFELTVFLFWLASGVSYRVVSCSTNIPKTTVHDMVKKMLNFTVENILPAVIRFPRSDVFASIGEKFNRRARTHIFDKAIGAIDGTHVRIQCPVKLHDQYINRKCDYSIQCQGVCDASMKFLNICVGFPGSVHDTRVLYNSSIYNKALYPPIGYFLLGDTGYPCRMYPINIITPFKESGTSTSNEQKHFNKLHSKARTIVECGFGQVKGRWRCIFNKDLELKIETTVKTISACFVFHNICIEMNDLILLDDNSETEENNDYDADIGRSDDGEGVAFREQLLRRLVRQSD